MTGQAILESIGKRTGNDFVIVDFQHVIKSLHKPLFYLPFPKQFIFDILFGRVKLYFMVDIDKYMSLFEQFGLKAEWLTRGETMKIIENHKRSGLFINKNRAIKVTSVESNESMYLNNGIFGKLYFEHVCPSYTAYACNYLLESPNAQ